MARPTVDIDTFLDGVKFRPFHVKVMLIGALAMLVDGFDLGVLSWVLPKISDQFGVARTSLTWVLSMQQVGMVLGAFLIAPFADQIGRRTLLVLCLGGVAATCFVTIFTDSIWALAICRLLTGMFASSVIANMVALASELAPARQRSTVVTVVLAGAMPGALLGSAMQAFLLEPYGWHVAFWIGTAMPLLLVPVIYFLLPESPKFLAARNPDDPRLRAIVLALMPEGEGEAVILSQREMREKRPSSASLVRDLFKPGLALPTILLWLSFVSSFGFISAALWKTTVFPRTPTAVGFDDPAPGVRSATGWVPARSMPASGGRSRVRPVAVWSATADATTSMVPSSLSAKTSAPRSRRLCSTTERWL